MKWQIWTATKSRVHVIVAKRYETGFSLSVSLYPSIEFFFVADIGVQPIDEGQVILFNNQCWHPAWFLKPYSIHINSLVFVVLHVRISWTLT